MNDQLDTLDLSTVPYGVIGNHEFIALYLAKHGPTRWKRLRQALLDWRGIKDASTGHFARYFTSSRHAGDGGYRGTSPHGDKYWWHPDIRTDGGRAISGKWIQHYNKEAARTGFQLTARGAYLASKALIKIAEFRKAGKMKERKNRVPEKHADLIREIALEKGPQMRYVLARSLCERLPEIQFKTALDYILSASKEGILQKIGMNYQAVKK